MSNSNPPQSLQTESFWQNITIRQQISKRTSLVCSVISIIILLAGYTMLSYHHQKGERPNRTIPTWSQLWGGVVYLFEKPERASTRNLLAAALGEESQEQEQKEGFLQRRRIWEASKATLGRLFAGLFIGIFFGALAGILMGCFLPVDAALSPIIYFTSRIIPTAAMPIFFEIAGIEFEMYVAMIVFGSMPVVTLTISKYVQEFPEELLNKAYTLGASNMEVVTTAIFPYMLPRIIEQAILMIGPALVYLIAAEYSVAGEGFGYRIRVLTRATRFEVIYPLIVILTFYGAIMTVFLKYLLAKLCPWYVTER